MISLRPVMLKKVYKRQEKKNQTVKQKKTPNKQIIISAANLLHSVYI